MTHQHRWKVEPAGHTRLHWDGEVTGELYTLDYRRGNLKGQCRCGAARLFHPFKGFRFSAVCRY